MSVTLLPEEAIALFSEDGKNWQDGSGVQKWTGNSAVTKIVLGTLEEDKSMSVEIPENLAILFPNLTHMHLWNISNLTRLPPLPDGLQCLDVRGCKRLPSLPVLPEGLEIFDLGGCSAFTTLPDYTPPRLTSFFFNGCAELKRKPLETFLSGASALAEVNGSGSPGVTSLDEFARSLKRIVLNGCPNLESLEGLPEFTGLRHLNLSSCPKLHSLPELPKSVQYLELRGSDKLRHFRGQDVGPYDRGNEQRPNVAKIFHSRMKFGAALAVAARAKLLLLGDGRAGKSTLAKRLQWDCLSEAAQGRANKLIDRARPLPEQMRRLPADQQQDWLHAEVKPNSEEPVTHGVRFIEWRTPLKLDIDVAESLNERAQSAHLPPPCSPAGIIPGSVCIWDFGGQEIYHQTHRIFASEGSVYLIVWSPEPVSRDQLMKEKPSGCPDEEWVGVNQQRPLDYWLDYVDSIRDPKAPPAKVILVCTHCPADAQRTPWTLRAEKHKDRDLQCRYIDCLDEQCHENPDYKKLVAEIRSLCGAEAARIGILQPDFYSGVTNYVVSLLRANEAGRLANLDGPEQALRPDHLLMKWKDWSAEIKRLQSVKGGASELDNNDVEAITGYLHDAGQIFHIQRQADHAVLVDQRWAAELIYEILRPGFRVRDVIIKNGGLFGELALKTNRAWESLATDLERSQILQYMQECGIVVRLPTSSDLPEGTLYLATEKWLLPKFLEMQSELDRQLRQVAELAGSIPVEHFSFENIKISELDFRTLMVHLGRVFGLNAKWFRNGLQAVDDRGEPKWCLRVWWLEDALDSFWGSVHARLAAPKTSTGEISEWIESLFASDGSPFTKYIHAIRRAKQEITDLSRAFFPGVRSYKVAVSSSGAQKDLANQLVAALDRTGFNAVWYGKEAPSSESKGLMQFMAGLSEPPCIVLILSEEYFRYEPIDNWYCAWELADAILQIHKRNRTVERTVVAFAPAGQLNSRNLMDSTIGALRKLAEFYLEAYRSKPVSDSHLYDHYLDWHRKFNQAVAHSDAFFAGRDTRGLYAHILKNEKGEWDFTEVVAHVQRTF